MLKFIRQAKVAANRMLCAAFGHKYKLKRRINYHVAELVCKRCKEEFGINKQVETVLPMDDELRAIHEDLLLLHKERLSLGR